ncbi:MAG TPA: hypothetical protein PKI16_01330 [Candidatus Dojkabacteria bacterium]|nr:hypothetical protein [Candidatus Dojkabacteria bacterium]
MLKVLYIIIGIIGALFIEGFLLSAFGIRIFFVLILLLLGRLDIKWLSGILVIYALISDVVFHYPLGIDILLVGIPLLLLFGSSFIFNINEGVVGYGIKLITIALYFVLILVLPPLFLNGSFGILTWHMVLILGIKSVLLVIVLYIMDILLSFTRGKENNIKISKKWN